MAVEYTECLNGMAVNGDESSLLAYTLEWSRTVNCGGLFEINDETFSLFKEIEVSMQWHLLSILESTLDEHGMRKLIINAVSSNDDVRFFWFNAVI